MMSSSLLVASFPLNKKNSCHGPRCVFGNTTTLTHVSKQQPQQSKHDHNTSFHFQNLAQLRCKQVRKQSCLSVERCFILFVIAALLRHLIYRMPYVSRDLLETDIEELIISRCAWLPRCVLLARCPWLIWFRIQFLWSVRAWHIAGLQKIHDLQKYIREISPARAGADGPCRGYAASESASESVSEFASESAWTPACKSHRWSVGICWRNFTYINVWLRVRIRVRINVGICAWICACDNMQSCKHFDTFHAARRVFCRWRWSTSRYTRMVSTPATSVWRMMRRIHSQISDSLRNVRLFDK